MFYDASFRDHEHWRRHYTRSPFYPMWTVIADRVCRSGASSILDIGCGPGQVAQLLRDKGIEEYVGIDFSAERVKRATQACSRFQFVEMDIFESTILSEHGYDTVLCLEFLEHVDQDTAVVERIRQGTLFWASVPNFGDRAHVRYFHEVKEVEDRYGAFFDEFRVDEHLVDDEGKKHFLLEGIRSSFTQF